MAINKRTKLNREGMKAVFVSTDDARNPAFFRGKAVSDGDFDAAIAVVDQDKIIDETDAQFTVDIWDRESKINGRSPADVVKATGLPSGCFAFIIRRNGKVAQVQTKYPGAGGNRYMTLAEATSCMQDCRQKSVNERSMMFIKRAIAVELDKRS